MIRQLFNKLEKLIYSDLFKTVLSKHRTLPLKHAVVQIIADMHNEHMKNASVYLHEIDVLRSYNSDLVAEFEALHAKIESMKAGNADNQYRGISEQSAIWDNILLSAAEFESTLQETVNQCLANKINDNVAEFAEFAEQSANEVLSMPKNIFDTDVEVTAYEPAFDVADVYPNKAENDAKLAVYLHDEIVMNKSEECCLSSMCTETIAEPVCPTKSELIANKKSRKRKPAKSDNA
jgi:hypothetical protein